VVNAFEQIDQLSSFAVNIVPLGDPGGSGTPHRFELGRIGREHFGHGVGQWRDRPGGNQPAVNARLDQLWNTCDICADHRPA